MGAHIHSDQWHKQANSLAQLYGTYPRRWGMRVTVYTSADAGEYVLSYGLSSQQLNDNGNWLKVADIGQTWGGGGGGAGDWDNVNTYDASGGLYPDGFITAAYQTVRFSVGGIMPDGNFWPAGTIAISLAPAPGQVNANWRLF